MTHPTLAAPAAALSASPMLTSLRRGLAGGAVGGAVAAAFGFVFARPVMDRAVDLEAARAAALGEVGGEETFSRSTQHVGFLVATVAVALAFGVLYGVVHALLHKDGDDAWGRALRLGGGAFFGVALVPFLRYPANPPGTGDSGTIETRADLWLIAIAMGVLGAVLAAVVAKGLRERGAPTSQRQLGVVGVLAATVALTFLLPDNTDEIVVPAQLVWEFRLLSLAAMVLLWGGLAATYGLLAERAARRTGSS